MNGFTNLNQFKINLRNFAELTEKQSVELLKKVALQVLTGVVEKTPVDTGRARANWQVSIGSADDRVLDKTDTGGASTIGEAVSVLAQVKPFSTVVIYNNVEYIVALENGHSKQAPQGMVKLTVAEVESQFP